MFRLLINGESAELDQRVKLQLSKTLLNLSDLSERGIKFTNAINLPFTEKNDRLTGFPSRLASNNDAFETNQIYQLVGDTGTISTGNVVLKDFDDKKGIKIQLAEGYDFWVQAGKKLLNDLVIHDQDFVFNIANMNALKSKGASVFITALHSATGDTTGTAITNFNQTRPCYYFRKVLEKIIESLGYTFDFGDVLSLTDLDFIGSLSNAEKFLVSDFKRRFQDVDLIGTLDISSGTDIFSKPGNVALATTTLTNQLYKTSYVIKGTVTAPISTSLLVNIGSKIERIIVPKGESFINFRSDELEIGSVITISTNDLVNLTDLYIYSAINENDIFEVESVINIDGYLVLADYNLPQHTQKQFIKNLFKLSFLNSDIDENKREIKFTYLPDQINTNNTIDLSGNVDRYFTVKSGNTYGQLNVLKYNNEDTISQELGSAFFTVNNDNAPENKDFLKIDEYSASDEITVSTNNVIVVSIYDTTENKRQARKNRIVFFEETGTFGINAVFNPLSFQRIYSDRYFPFVEATKRERVIVLTSFLTTLQFNALQTKPVVYIDFLESHFLIAGVKGFQEDKKCKLEAIKFN